MKSLNDPITLVSKNSKLQRNENKKTQSYMTTNPIERLQQKSQMIQNSGKNVG